MHKKTNLFSTYLILTLTQQAQTRPNSEQYPQMTPLFDSPMYT